MGLAPVVQQQSIGLLHIKLPLIKDRDSCMSFIKKGDNSNTNMSNCDKIKGVDISDRRYDNSHFQNIIDVFFHLFHHSYYGEKRNW